VRFASLASGSRGNCLVAEAAGTRVLLDCGLPPRETARRLARLGVDPEGLSAILVTHEHEDHVGGVFAFAAAHSLTVYLTRGTLRAAADAGKVVDGVRTELIDGRGAFAVGALEARPFTVPHDAREPVQYVLSDGAFALGVLTDIGAPTPHVAEMLSGCDALVLECNHDRAMLRDGSYPQWLKQRIGGPLGHLDNDQAAALLASLDRSRLRHMIGAHLSQQNNRPELARAALARALGCAEDWVGVASQDEGFAWRDLR
jgi:phosphoribosyl 1,2-cyclic phosphodiesterase